MLTNKNRDKVFVEIASYQTNKHKQVVCGDTFSSRKINGENRYVAVLSDGLGSGIKANVLSTMTTSMALNYRMRHEPIVDSAISIMNALPIDSERGISYATFSIVDIDFEGETRIAEFDNPEFIFLCGTQQIDPSKSLLYINNDNEEFKIWDSENMPKEEDLKDLVKVRKLKLTHLKLCKGDRIIIFSDGVSQAGMGTKAYPFGWNNKHISDFIINLLRKKPDTSARDLSHRIVEEALAKDNYAAKDDITCSVIYSREPRYLLLVSGPPYDSQKDQALGKLVENYNGKKIICGGTTSKIIARELKRDISVDIQSPLSRKYPPLAKIEGIDLITEGILTLGAVSELLEQENITENTEKSPANLIVRMIMESDIIDLVIGTRINEAHQDPSLPVELEIRRNVVKKISNLIEEKWLKKVNIQYI